MWSLGEGRAPIDGAKADGGGGRSGRAGKGSVRRGHTRVCVADIIRFVGPAQ